MMYRKTVGRLATYGLLLLSIVACSDSEEVQINVISANELNGTWVSSCVVNNDGNGEIDTYTIAGNTVRLQNDTFISDTSCITRAIALNTSGTYTTGDAVPQATGPAATEVNITLRSATVTYFGTNVINNANINEVCGRANWQEGVSQDVTTCLGLPTISYDIFRVDGNLLYVSDEDSGDSTAPESRPTRLDLANPLTR
ncbi:MAG: hypothetical protein AB8B64_05230 [Granulosicoccus sp.]